jgi:hypothetical protein
MKSIGDWLGALSTPTFADGDDGDFRLEDNMSEDDFAAEPRLMALARHLDTRFRVYKCRTKAAVESLLQNWCAGAKAAQLQFWKDAQLIVTFINQQISHTSTFLWQLSAQTMEQLHLFNVKLADLDRRADKKLMEVDVAHMSVGTSLSSMKDSIMSATQAL